MIGKTYIASDATVVGRVTIGDNSAVFNGSGKFLFFGGFFLFLSYFFLPLSSLSSALSLPLLCSVVRGDVSTVSVGNNTTIADRVMIHVSGTPKEIPTIIGNDVTIRAGAIIHGAQIGDKAVIGEGAQVSDGAIIGNGAYVTAGTIITKGKVVKPNEIWSGVPGKLVGTLTALEAEKLEQEKAENIVLAAQYLAESSKNYIQVIRDAEEAYEKDRGAEYFPRLTVEELERLEGRIEGRDFPGRILDTDLSARSLPPYHPKPVFPEIPNKGAYSL